MGAKPERRLQRGLLPMARGALLASTALVALGAGPAWAINNEGDLITAITNADGAGGPTTITLTGDITLTGPLPAIGAAGDDITIDLGGNTLSGGGTHRILFVNAGTVTVANGTLEDGVAKGGNGGNGDGVDSGGGGMGAGGALYVRGDLGASVTVENVAFSNNRVMGGTGGSSTAGDLGPGGGGLGGNGGAGTATVGGGGGAFAGDDPRPPIRTARSAAGRPPVSAEALPAATSRAAMVVATTASI